MQLGVNIDHLGTLRQARLPIDRQGENNEVYPNLVKAAKICQAVGAHSIVMHLREDRRHIQDRDLFAVKESISIRLNLEMSIAADVIKIAHKLIPAQTTLVPEKRKERTTESGLDLFYKTDILKRVIISMKERGIDVSLFIDPNSRQICQAKKL